MEPPVDWLRYQKPQEQADYSIPVATYSEPTRDPLASSGSGEPAESKGDTEDAVVGDESETEKTGRADA